ncbi:hypothetical protein R2601_03408 [Salipiger bermudensis HTCC2601]|uniref:Uncharacterized protein n=1 Tax=Salipiger bermudensis (strain DSM 26914 / JCM 13377 / KCTC 12554 / HTCC2601) TaxID=314265 RepID=Q0FWG4_SALBH|nr:hypothetical protein R2601_03408 [Salipiger bermudensis HTCC2601]
MGILCGSAGYQSSILPMASPRAAAAGGRVAHGNSSGREASARRTARQATFKVPPTVSSAASPFVSSRKL